MQIQLKYRDESSSASKNSIKAKQESIDLWKIEDNSFIDSDDLFSKWSEEPENIVTYERHQQLFDIEHNTASIIKLPTKSRINYSEVIN